MMEMHLYVTNNKHYTVSNVSEFTITCQYIRPYDDKLFIN